MKGMKESLPVFAAFLAGLLFGAGGLVPSWLLAPGLPMALLSVLVFLAGVGLLSLIHISEPTRPY